MKNKQRVHVVVLGTSDIHGNLLGFSYEDNVPTQNSGLARFATYLENVRKNSDAVILLDAGDFLQGNILTDNIALNNSTIHPVIAAMNTLGYDAITLGNHEFNWGTRKLKSFLKDATMPVLGANILEDGTFFTGTSHVILEKQGIRFGIIGVTTPDIPYWDGGNPEVARCSFLPAPETVQKEIEEIKDNVDCILVSAHMGMDMEFPKEQGADSGRCILEKNPEVDILQVGHCHITVKGEQGKALFGGCRNEALEAVRFDLYFEDKALVEKSVSIIKMEDQKPSDTLLYIPAVQEAHQKTIDFASGTDEKSILGTTTAVFQPRNTIEGIPEAYLRNTPLPDFINSVMMEATGADVSAAPLFKLTSDLPKGNIFYKNIFNIYKFANVLCRLRLSGKELKKWLEWNATFYHTEDGKVSFSEDFPYFAYDLFLGVDFTIDLSQKEGERIQKATLHGRPLEEVESLTVAVAQYRYSSLIQGKGIVEAELEWQAPLSVRDYIVEHFGKHSPLDPKDYLGSNWKLIGHEGKLFTSEGLALH